MALVPSLLEPRPIESQPRLAPPSEYEVKAAYLFHFASFVEWPEDAFPDDGGRIVVGVLGEDPFDGILEDTLAGKSVLRRGFVIKHGPRMEDLGHPHILFIGAAESARIPHILSRLKETSVLTVGESRDFAALGGIINFTVRDHRVRFEVNLATAKRARLKISSQLLKLATITEQG